MFMLPAFAAYNSKPNILALIWYSVFRRRNEVPFMVFVFEIVNDDGIEYIWVEPVLK